MEKIVYSRVVLIYILNIFFFLVMPASTPKMVPFYGEKNQALPPLLRREWCLKGPSSLKIMGKY